MIHWRTRETCFAQVAGGPVNFRHGHVIVSCWALGNSSRHFKTCSPRLELLETLPMALRCCLVTVSHHGSFSQRLQELTLVRTLNDAWDVLTSVCWNQQLLAAAGWDKKIWIYNSEKDAEPPLSCSSHHVGKRMFSKWLHEVTFHKK